MKYKIIAEIKGEDDEILFETNDLFTAECALYRYINYGYDAYLVDM